MLTDWLGQDREWNMQRTGTGRVSTFGGFNGIPFGQDDSWDASLVLMMDLRNLLAVMVKACHAVLPSFRKAFRIMNK